MDMKEKLVELIRRAITIWDKGDVSVAIADHLIANGATVQEWISVKDRLPEESGEYLAYCGEHDGICVLYFEILKTKSKWRTKWKEVTHWQYLPQPPKGE